MSTIRHSYESAVRLASVHLARSSDIDSALSSWPQLLTLTSITIGTGLVPEHERRERQARIDARLSDCHCRESGLGMAAGAGLYAAAWALFSGLRTSSLWTDMLVGLGVALVVGAVARVVGYVLNRRQVRRELRALRQVMGRDSQDTHQV